MDIPFGYVCEVCGEEASPTLIYVGGEFCVEAFGLICPECCRSCLIHPVCETGENLRFGEVPQ